MRLPREKLERLAGEITNWSRRKSCTRSELQSLTRQLQLAVSVVKPGRTFLRRMYDLLKVGTRLGKRAPTGGQYSRLNLEFRSDLAWWSQLLCQWNGVSLLTATNSRQPRTHTLLQMHQEPGGVGRTGRANGGRVRKACVCSADVTTRRW